MSKNGGTQCPTLYFQGKSWRQHGLVLAYAATSGASRWTCIVGALSFPLKSGINSPIRRIGGSGWSRREVRTRNLESGARDSQHLHQLRYHAPFYVLKSAIWLWSSNSLVERASWERWTTFFSTFHFSRPTLKLGHSKPFLGFKTTCLFIYLL